MGVMRFLVQPGELLKLPLDVVGSRARGQQFGQPPCRCHFLKIEEKPPLVQKRGKVSYSRNRLYPSLQVEPPRYFQMQ